MAFKFKQRRSLVNEQASDYHSTSHQQSSSHSRPEVAGLPQSQKRKLERLSSSEDSSSSSSSSGSSSGSESDSEPKPKSAHYGPPDTKPYATTNGSLGRRMLDKMGYTDGKGLGKHSQGIVEPIEPAAQKGRRGLGYSLSDVKIDEEFEWSEEKEAPYVSVREQYEWLNSCSDEPPTDLNEWLRFGPKKQSVHDEVKYCDKNVVRGVMSCKEVFERLSSQEMGRARSMSNPFESIQKVFFQNRAALKMANLDSIFDNMFTDPKDDQGRSLLKKSDLLYFADICAGPGGFSEYVLWKCGWEARGFGFTLKASNDFKLEEFHAASTETFEPHYGKDPLNGDGNIYDPKNLIAFRQHVLEMTDEGVHFVMADGGFSFVGQEHLQEVLSKRLYLCQFLCALGILRKRGHFVCKLFDLFTPFSVGLLYLMYRCFDQVCLVKPNTSRPANSERYLVCKGKRDGTVEIENYLFRINCELQRLEDDQSSDDIIEIVPEDVILDDSSFSQYIYKSNTELGKRQIVFLSKIKAFAEDEGLAESRQFELKRACLKLWQIPMKARTVPVLQNHSTTPEAKYKDLMSQTPSIDTSVFSHKPTTLTKDLLKTKRNPLEFASNFHCMVLSGEDVSSNSAQSNRGFYLCMGKGVTHYWDGSSMSKWRRMNDIATQFPKDTLFYGELVLELHGEGRGQRRRTALHIIDALFVGGKDVRTMDFEDRRMYIGKLLKAIHKPTVLDPSAMEVRVKKVFDLTNLEELFNEHMEMRECKTGSQRERLCFDVTNDRFVDPCGLLIFQTTSNKYIRSLSKSSGKYYFFSKSSKKSVFEKPSSAVCNFSDTFANRLFWRWDNVQNLQPEPNSKLKPDEAIDRYSLLRQIRT